MARRRPSLSLVLAAFAVPFVIYACTLPDYVYDDAAFAKAQGKAGQGGDPGVGGSAGAAGNSAGGLGGKAGGGAGASGSSVSGASGQNPGGASGGQPQGGEAGEGPGGGGGESGQSHGGEAGSSGHPQSGDSGASGTGSGSSGASGSGSGASGTAGASGSAGSGGTAGTGQSGSNQGGAGSSGGNQAGAGQAGAGQSGSSGSAGSSGSGPTGCVVQRFDFESGEQGFTSTGKTNPWQWGKASIGPKADHTTGSGSLWGTRTTAQPSYCEDAFLESPAIDLTPHSGKPVKLKVWHWSQFRGCDSSGFFCGPVCSPPIPIIPVYSLSGGAVEVFTNGSWQVIKPNEDYGASGQPMTVNGGSGDPADGGTPPCQESSLDEKKYFAANGPTGQWVLSTFNLSAYTSAADFKMRVHFASAPKDSCYPNRDGWFVDDIELSYDGACK